MQHRQQLSIEFEKLIEIRNELHQQMSEKREVVQLRLSLLSQIDEWQNTTIEKVHRTAAKTRDQMVQLLDDKLNDVDNEFDYITKQLRDLQQMENFVENDLSHLNNHISQLQKKFRQITELPSVKLNKQQSEQIDWMCIIFADDKCDYDRNLQVT